VDYATLNDHEECVQVLRERGGVSISAIKVEAAIRIQSVYRGYRSVNTLIMVTYFNKKFNFLQSTCAASHVTERE
jgi:hypothetical protein